MQKGILAAKEQQARQRIVEAASQIATSEQVEALKQAQAEKRPEIAALRELEALGDIVEAVATGGKSAPSGIDLDELLALEGLSKSSQKAILAHFS